MADLTGPAFVLAGTIVTIVLGWVGTVIARRIRGNRASEPEMWARVDELSVAVYGGRDKDGKEQLGLQRELALTRDDLMLVRQVAAAQGRVIAAVVRQAPPGWVPRLNPLDLEVIDETTIPTDSPWRLRPDHRSVPRG